LGLLSEFRSPYNEAGLDEKREAVKASRLSLGTAIAQAAKPSAKAIHLTPFFFSCALTPQTPQLRFPF